MKPMYRMPPGRITVADLAAKASRTVPARLLEQVAVQPDRLFLTMQDVRLTYGQFNQLANEAAAGFAALGVGKGDPVCQMLPNCLAFVVNWIGLAKLGAIEVGINNEFTGPALVRMLNLTEARVLVLDAAFAAQVAAIADQLPHLDHIVLHGAADRAPVPGLGRFRVGYYEDLAVRGAGEPEVAISRVDPLMLVFTSGTTGVSKAVEISHNYGLHFAAEMIENWGLLESDVLYSPYPLFHTEASVLTFLTALHRGCGVAIGRKFSASRFWDEVRDFGATFTTFMGAVTTILHKRDPLPEDADNPLRLVASCPTPPFWRDFEKRFDLKVVETYGSSEASQVSWDPLDRPHKDGACGRLTDRYEVRIADDFDDSLPPGEIGEILIRPRESYTMMTGYFRNPEATAAVWRNLWYHTGDLGFVDDENYLHFIGRKKDSIRRRGKNISAFEVEEVLDGHPGILESAIIGVPSELTEDEVKAIIVLRPGHSLTPGQFAEWAASDLPRYAVPRYVEFVDALPKSSTGKVQKVELRAQWNNGNTYDAETRAYLKGTAN